MFQTTKQKFIFSKIQDSFKKQTLTSAVSPGLPEEHPAAELTLLNPQVVQVPAILLLVLRVSELLGEDSVFRFVVCEFVKQVF